MSEHLIETWQIHSRINRYLLDAVPDEALANVGPAKGRSVGAQFAHIHNVRLMWLKASAPALLEGLGKLEGDAVHEKAALASALESSSTAIASMVQDALARDGKIKGFKPHATAFVGYLIAHESHHRGQTVLTLKQTGAPLAKQVLFGLWEWGVR